MQWAPDRWARAAGRNEAEQEGVVSAAVEQAAAEMALAREYGLASLDALLPAAPSAIPQDAVAGEADMSQSQEIPPDAEAGVADMSQSLATSPDAAAGAAGGGARLSARF